MVDTMEVCSVVASKAAATLVVACTAVKKVAAV